MPADARGDDVEPPDGDGIGDPSGGESEPLGGGEREPLGGVNATRLNDAGFSLAAGAVTYWVGEATHGTVYQNLDETPDAVATTIQPLATNAATWPVGSPAVPDPAA